MGKDKIRWDIVDKYTKEYGVGSIGQMFGYPTVTDPTHTIFATDEVDVQPRWEDVPDKIIVSTAITGSFYNKKGNPNHPVTMEEIYKSAREACKAGAPIIHIHVRDDMGYNVLDVKKLTEFFERIKDEFPEVAIDTCLVPYSKDENGWNKMIQMLETGWIESSPVNTCTVYCGDSLLTKYPHVMIAKTRELRKYGVRPRVAVYTDGDIDNADRWLFKTGMIETGEEGKPSYWGLLPALPGGSPMHSAKAMVQGFTHLTSRIQDIDKDAIIQVCASGRACSYLATQAIITGHHLRVGMEDTVWRWPHKNEKLSSNARCFLEYKQLCEILGREIMTADEYREKLGIKNSAK